MMGSVGARRNDDPPAPLPQRITWLGHATALIDLGGTQVLTDPVLRDRLMHLVRVSDPIEDTLVEALDAVVISHMHSDHFDVPSLRKLKRDTPLIVPRGGGRPGARLGFREVTELPVGESLTIGAAEVTAVPAVHGAGRWPWGEKTDTIGFTVSGGGKRVYFAGDTDLFDEMSDLAEPALDAALIPVWGWGPALGPGHLDPERAAEAVARLRPRLAVPIHWGTLYPQGLRRFIPHHLEEPAGAVPGGRGRSGTGHARRGPGSGRGDRARLGRVADAADPQHHLVRLRRVVARDRLRHSRAR